MHAFFNNLANRDRQTDKRKRVNALTCSFVGGKIEVVLVAKAIDYM